MFLYVITSGGIIMLFTSTIHIPNWLSVYIRRNSLNIEYMVQQV